MDSNKRKTYDELVDYLESGQEKIKYPDRFAKFLRESPQLSNLLDGEGIDYETVVDQQKKSLAYQEIQNRMRMTAAAQNETHAHSRATANFDISTPRSQPAAEVEDFQTPVDDLVERINIEEMVAGEKALSKRNQIAKKKRTCKKHKEILPAGWRQQRRACQSHLGYLKN